MSTIVANGQFGVRENADCTFTITDGDGRSIDITLSEFEPLAVLLEVAWQEIWRQYKNAEPLTAAK